MCGYWPAENYRYSKKILLRVNKSSTQQRVIPSVRHLMEYLVYCCYRCNRRSSFEIVPHSMVTVPPNLISVFPLCLTVTGFDPYLVYPFHAGHRDFRDSRWTPCCASASNQVHRRLLQIILNRYASNSTFACTHVAGDSTSHRPHRFWNQL